MEQLVYKWLLTCFSIQIGYCLHAKQAPFPRKFSLKSAIFVRMVPGLRQQFFPSNYLPNRFEDGFNLEKHSGDVALWD